MPPSEFYSRGYSVGQSAARANTSIIKKDKNSLELSILAGDMVKGYSRRSEDWMSDSPSWRTGFWEGFMDMAEKIRGDR